MAGHDYAIVTYLRQALRGNAGTALRQPAQRKVRGGAGAATPYPRIAPVRGWMTSENLANMPEDAAYVMDNWFPETDHVRARRGSETVATLPDADPVRTMMAYQSGTTAERFAAQNGNIYNVTAGGSITVPDVTGQTGDEYIYLNFATSGGNFLVTANGHDDPINYDGTNWANPAITGVTDGADTLNFVFSYKSRLFYIQNDTSDVWYLPSDSIAGAANKLALGGFLTLGGPIIAGGAISVDSGFGPNDYIAFISQEGEVVAYSGTDPSDPTDWVLRGVFRITRPIGNRCTLKIAGDIGVLCSDGLISLTQAIQLDLAAQQKGAYSNNIRTAFNNQYNLTGGLFGWQIVSWPTAHMAIVNVPITLDTESQQYVMNVLTGSWARYIGMNASSFCLSETTVYYGSVDGKVIQFETNNSDDGETINCNMILSYSAMKRPGQLKHVKAMQVFFRGSGQYSIGLNIASEFQPLDSPIATQDISNTTGSLWDVALWDSATWGQSGTVNQRWLGVAGGGYYLAPCIFAQSNNESSDEPTDIQFLTSNLLYETGAILG